MILRVDLMLQRSFVKNLLKETNDALVCISYAVPLMVQIRRIKRQQYFFIKILVKLALKRTKVEYSPSTFIFADTFLILVE